MDYFRFCKDRLIYVDENNEELDSSLRPYIHNRNYEYLLRFLIVDKDNNTVSITGIQSATATIKQTAIRDDDILVFVDSDEVNTANSWSDGTSPLFSSGQITLLATALTATFESKAEDKREIPGTMINVKLFKSSGETVVQKEVLPMPIRCFNIDSISDEDPQPQPTPSSDYVRWVDGVAYFMARYDDYTSGKLIKWDSDGQATNSTYSDSDILNLINEKYKVSVDGTDTGDYLINKVDSSEFEENIARDKITVKAIDISKITDGMDITVYDSNADGRVDSADTATTIDGASIAGNQKYYGTNATGTVGFYSLTCYNVDDTTIQSIDGTISLKDGGITIGKLNSNMLSTGSTLNTTVTTRGYVDEGLDLKMTTSTYDSNADGRVDASDTATTIDGASVAGNKKYYGTNDSGVVGFYTITCYAVDDITIQSVGETISLKDGGITIAKFNASILSTGVSDNDTITTKGYVDDNFVNRTLTTYSHKSTLDGSEKIYIENGTSKYATTGQILSDLTRDDDEITDADLVAGIYTISGNPTIACIVDNNGVVDSDYMNGITEGATNTTIDFSLIQAENGGSLPGTWKIKYASSFNTQSDIIRYMIDGSVINVDSRYYGRLDDVNDTVRFIQLSDYPVLIQIKLKSADAGFSGNVSLIVGINGVEESEQIVAVPASGAISGFLPLTISGGSADSIITIRRNYASASDTLKDGATVITCYIGEGAIVYT